MKVYVTVKPFSKAEDKLCKVFKKMNLDGPKIYLGALLGLKLNGYIFEMSPVKARKFIPKLKTCHSAVGDDIGLYDEAEKSERFLIKLMSLV